MIKIGIVGYNLGNQDSLFYVLKSLGFSVHLSKKIENLSKSNVIILPGVGAFPQAMSLLKKNNLVDFLVDWSNQNKPILGICLGMQILCTKSHEFKESSGLNIIDGEIIPLKGENCHIGWNNNEIIEDNLFEQGDDKYFYFNHSFKYEGNKNNILSYTKFNNEVIPSIIKKGNIVGVQFHPEKSQDSGKNLILKIVEKLVYD